MRSLHTNPAPTLLMDAFQREEVERVRMALVGLVPLVREHAPVGRAEVEVRVAGDLGVDLCEIDALGERQELLEDVRPAEHDDLRRVACERERLVRGSRDLYALRV